MHSTNKHSGLLIYLFSFRYLSRFFVCIIPLAYLSFASDQTMSGLIDQIPPSYLLPSAFDVKVTTP